MIPQTVTVSGPTSLSLLARVRQSEPEAWRRFARLYGGLVYGWARRLHLQEADAADVMQNVFEAVHRSLAQYRPEASGSFRGWLWTITLNKTRDLIRTRRRRPETPGGEAMQQRLLALPDALEADLFPEPAATGADLLKQAADLISEEFDPKSWTCFERMVIAGQSAAEAAADLQMSVAAVRQAKYRVLRHLRTFCSEFL
jgi:RNA polymerase sigma-70 factor (ECF subfamily)